MNIYGTVGVWTGCGISTVAIILPPMDILGYDACVPPILDGGSEAIGVVDFVGPPVPNGDVPFVDVLSD